MILKEVLEKNGFGRKAMVFGLWNRLMEKVKGLESERKYSDRIAVTSEPEKVVINGLNRNLIRYAGLVMDKVEKDAGIDFEVEMLGFLVKKAYERVVNGNYDERFVLAISNIDSLVSNRIEKEVFGKRVATDAEVEYVENVADEIVEDKFRVEVADGGIVRIGKFRKVFSDVESAMDFMRNFWSEIGYSNEEILEKLAYVDFDKFKTKKGVSIDLEKSVLVLAEELEKEINRNDIAEIIERAINLNSDSDFEDKVGFVKREFGIDGDVDELGIIHGLYEECCKKIGKEKAKYIFKKVFKFKKAVETYLSNEDEGTVAVIDDTGRVRIKEKDTGVDRGEEVYKSKEEAIASLGAKGYK